MRKAFCLLTLTVLFLSGCNPKFAPPTNEPESEAKAKAETRPETPSPSSAASSPTTTENPQRNATTRRSNAAPPAATSGDSTLKQLQRRQQKAERFANDDARLADAVREADYVASTILVGQLNQRGSDGDGQNAREYATLLESALTTLGQCAERADATRSAVPESETTSVVL